MPGFGCDKLPVRIARGGIAREGPKVDDRHLRIQASLYDFTGFVAVRGDQSAHEADSDPVGAAMGLSVLR